MSERYGEILKNAVCLELLLSTIALSRNYFNSWLTNNLTNVGWRELNFIVKEYL